jgi:hypothetical protein
MGGMARGTAASGKREGGDGDVNGSIGMRIGMRKENYFFLCERGRHRERPHAKRYLHVRERSTSNHSASDKCLLTTKLTACSN